MKKKNLLMTAFAFAAFSGQGHATEAGPGYFGLSFGHAEVKDFCEGGYRSCDDTAFTGRIYGGLDLNGYTALELGYRYMDEVEVSGSYQGALVEVESAGHFVDATLQLGVPQSGPFQVFAKAGALYWILEHKAKASSGSLSASASDEDDGMAFQTGIGARYELSDDISLRADWDYLVDIGADDAETDIQVFSFGPEVRF